MDFGKAFSFVFEDDDWLKKLGIGALVVLASMFLIPLPILLGYQVAVAQNVREGVKRPLPSWDDLGSMFVDGLALLVALLAYSIVPMLVLFGCFFLIVIPTAGSGASEDAIGAIVGTSTLLTICLMALIGIVVSLIIPGVFVQYLRTRELGACFRVGEIWALVRDNIADVLLIWAAGLAANIVLQLAATVSAITVCGPIVLGLAGAVWYIAVLGHLYGQLAAKIDGKGMSKEAQFDF